MYKRQVDKEIEISSDVTGTNLLSAINNGTRDGIKMAVNVGAMLLVFLALIALVNGLFFQIADSKFVPVTSELISMSLSTASV